MTMRRSQIGYCGTGADGRPITWYYAWNPGGFGCSGGCDGCWARGIVTRFGRTRANVPRAGGLYGCQECEEFAVHFHEERLAEPSATGRPGVVLVDFTCDTFDPRRPDAHVYDILCTAAAEDAARHTYVWLTQWPHRAAQYLRARRDLPANWCLGLTVRRYRDDVAAFLTIPMDLWLSVEPIERAMDLAPWLVLSGEWGNGTIRGVIVGHDSRRHAPGTETLDHVRGVVDSCRDAGVPVYVKQLWLPRCEHCGWLEHANADAPFGRRCRLCGGRMRWRLERDPSRFPADLRLRNLPWSMPSL